MSVNGNSLDNEEKGHGKTKAFFYAWETTFTDRSVIGTLAGTPSNGVQVFESFSLDFDYLKSATGMPNGPIWYFKGVNLLDYCDIHLLIAETCQHASNGRGNNMFPSCQLRKARWLKEVWVKIPAVFMGIFTVKPRWTISRGEDTICVAGN